MTDIMKQYFSPACERNKEPIAEVLSIYLEKKGRLLEIGSGTGQHASYFAPLFPKIEWHTSDRKENHLAIKEWIQDIKMVKGPHRLNLGVDDFPKLSFQYIFTANTLHIMSWKECKTLFKLLSKRLREGSLFLVYGPFNYQGGFTSESNKLFDEMLRQRNPLSGIRSFEIVQSQLESNGFHLVRDHEMPANNRLLSFIKNKF